MMKTLNEIKHNLKQHYGSETCVRHGLVKASIASEGALDYFEQAECFWLWDIIATEVYPAVKKAGLDVYYFKIISENEKANLTLHNYKDDLLWKKNIGFTTHPEGEMNLIVGWDGNRSIICLTSEN